MPDHQALSEIDLSTCVSGRLLEAEEKVDGLSVVLGSGHPLLLTNSLGE